MSWKMVNDQSRELRLTAGEKAHAAKWGMTEKQFLAFLRNGVRNDPHRTPKRRLRLSGREYEA